MGTNQLLLSSKKLSSIFKVSNIGSLMTKVDYIIADQKLYKKYAKKYRKKVLTKYEEESAAAEETEEPANILHKPVKEDPFVSQYGQETITYKKKSAEGQYTLNLFSAKAGKSSKGDGKSYYMTFSVDETTKTYELKKQNVLEQTKNDGNYIPNGEQYIYCCSDKGFFTESDLTGRVLKNFTATSRPYRVYKRDFKGFWFH